MILGVITNRYILAMSSGLGVGKGFDIRWDFSGFAAAKKALQEVGKQVNQAVSDALHEEGAKVIYTAKEYVPIETGELKASGAVKLISGKYEKVIRLSFGGPAGIGNVGETNSEDVDYAAAVHEIPPERARHGAAIGKPENQQWKYLERAAIEHESSIKRNVASRIKRKLGT